nr:extracellular solute-binding protein [Paenibacillus caui]
MEPDEFRLLQEQNELFIKSHHVTIDLVNEYGRDAHAVFGHELALHEAPDVMLLDNAWVREFAVKGYLLPADSYFSGAAAGNSLSALQTYSEWNGYVWAVPKDVDPYVLIYNPERLSALGYEGMPATLEDWSRLAKAAGQSQANQSQANRPGYFIAFDFSDPYSFLSLIRRMGGNGSKEETAGYALTDGEKGALLLLENIRASLYDASSGGKQETVWSMLGSGEAVMAVARYSEFRANPDPKLRIEMPSNLPSAQHMAGAGRSFAVFSGTGDPDTANEWIAAMTESAQQKSWYEATGKLPAFKPLYKASSSAEIAGWLPENSDKGLLWNMPLSENSASFLKLLSGLAASFLRGEMPREAFMLKYSAEMKQARP